MIRSYTLEISQITQGMILPALEVLNLEHRLRENDFIALTNQSPTVPKDRIRLFAKGLYLGYDGDFVGALHLLVPQIENMVRQRLRAIGCKTSTVGDDSVETENGLSALIVLPEVTELFGEDLGFELRALLCDAAGPNLRNEIAHGLFGDSVYYSVASVYTWWLSLKLVLNSFWNSTFPDVESGSSTDNDQQSVEE